MEPQQQQQHSGQCQTRSRGTTAEPTRRYRCVVSNGAVLLLLPLVAVSHYANHRHLTNVAATTASLLQTTATAAAANFYATNATMRLAREALLPQRNASQETFVDEEHTDLNQTLMPLSPRATTGTLLIAQYAAAPMALRHHHRQPENFYDRYLATTARVNQAYAVAWRCDYLILRGTPFAGPHLNESYTVQRLVVDGRRIAPPLESLRHAGEEEADDAYHNNNVPDSRATYNKVAVLELALAEKKYDCVLILDADAMLYDFSRDITTLLPRKNITAPGGATPALLVAHKTNRSDVAGTGGINVGVTLWNLRHRLTPLVARRWRAHCARRVRRGRRDDDQAPLQGLLRDELDPPQRALVVHAISREFAYARGRFVRHFVRADGTAWDSGGGGSDGNNNNNTAAAMSRLERMEETAREVCARYHPVCDR